jgi:hypothetical protein
MTIGFGRRRLIVSYIVEQVRPLHRTFPAAEQASEAELARLNAARDTRKELLSANVSAPLYGVGFPR